MQKNRLERISNSYYNFALEYAKERNLTSALLFLQNSLEYNKDNVDARNLLGLVYYEMGEVASALVSWVLSINIRKINNIAEFYIFELQKKPDRMKNYDDIIKRYNQALISVKDGNMDLAVLGLARIVDANPKYIRAALLLSLLYINKKDYIRADKVISGILKVDKCNHLALKYRECIKEDLKKLKKELKQINSDGVSISDDVIIPSTYKQYTGWQTAVNIAIGLLIGSAFIMFLYIPTMKAKLNNTYNAELAGISEKLNQANIEKNEINAKVDELTTERDRLKEASNTSAESINYKSIQYQKLLAMQKSFSEGDFTRVADLYSDFDSGVITNIDDGTGFDSTALVAEIKAKVDAEGSDLLLTHGNSFFDKGEYDKAISFYDKALKLKGDNIAAVLKKGQALTRLGRNDEANTVFSDIVINYPDAPEAEAAKAERGY